MSLKLLILLISLGLGHSQVSYSVCNCTVQLQKVNNEIRKETQTSISSVRKEIDALRNVTRLLLGQYMLPTDPQSGGEQCTCAGGGEQCTCAPTDQLGTRENPASSCQQIAEDNPSSLPGYFWVTSGSDSPAFVYCTPNTHCCTNSSIQGWMRVANLDMTDPRQGCPTGFRLTTSPKRGCFRTTTPGCTSVTFDTHNITYSNICGRVIGYRHHSPDAFLAYYNNRGITLDDTYVDGVSITRGYSPRQHIWTFAATHGTSPASNTCPCMGTGATFPGAIPPFINDEYFCEYGTTTQPMWDSGDCLSTSTCCTFNNSPWFCKQLSQTTTDEIEVRVCADQSTGDEDVQIEVIELYVQ